MRSLVAWVLLVVACGKVEQGTVGHIADAPALDAFTCSGANLACDATCVDPTSDNNNCGDCGIACGVGTSCTAGICTDPDVACVSMLASNPALGSGLYHHGSNGSPFYCDMTATPTQYESLAIAEFDKVPVGYNFVSLANFQTAGPQQAFIALMNEQGGATRLGSAFQPGNCCLKYDGSTGTPSNFMVNNGNLLVFIGNTNGTAACGQLLSGSAYTWYFDAAPVPVPPLPLPTNFFASNVFANNTTCGDSLNAAFFWEVR